jgi:hypothetical protein
MAPSPPVDATTGARYPTVAQRLVCAVGVIALLLLGLDQLRPPSCPNDAGGVGASDFSCERALGHVRAIASVKHPSGLPADDAARDYLLGQMREMGLSPRVLPVRVVAYGKLITLDNLLARLPGKTPGPAVMLCCHYDSALWGPGAGDDGAAVGALLETMRALEAGPPLRNDIYLLITDGEELGLMGARGLMKEPQVLPEVGIVLNFDARGTCGPSVLFETSSGNESLVRQFARVAPDPIGTSLGYDVYRKMPNDTDFTIFRRAGWRGLNFAFIGNYVYYHTAEDSIEHLDRRTLYHDGAYALALARHFGKSNLAELNRQPAADAVFFNPLRGVMVVYASRWNWPITIILVVATLAAIIMLFRRREVRMLGLLLALARLTLGIAGAAGADWALWKLARLGLQRGWIPSFPGFLLLDSPTPAEVSGLVIIYSSIAIIIALAFAFTLPRLSRIAELAAAGALVWAAASVAVTIWLPGGSYLPAWTALFAIPAMLFPRPAEPRDHWLRLAGVLVCSAPALLMLPPSIALFFTALTVRSGFIVAPIIVLAVWLLITSGCIPFLIAAPIPGRSTQAADASPTR